MKKKFNALLVCAGVAALMSCSKPSGKKAMQEVCDCYSTLLTREYITKKDIRYVEDSCAAITQEKYKESYNTDDKFKSEVLANKYMFESIEKQVKEKMKGQVEDISLWDLIIKSRADLFGTKKEYSGRNIRLTGWLKEVEESNGYKVVVLEGVSTKDGESILMDGWGRKRPAQDITRYFGVATCKLKNDASLSGLKPATNDEFFQEVVVEGEVFDFDHKNEGFSMLGQYINIEKNIVELKRCAIIEAKEIGNKSIQNNASPAMQSTADEKKEVSINNDRCEEFLEGYERYVDEVIYLSEEIKENPDNPELLESFTNLQREQSEWINKLKDCKKNSELARKIVLLNAKLSNANN
ncbi:MAG: hypothetical protein WC150_13310 [Bacteroidia bacterium]